MLDNKEIAQELALHCAKRLIFDGKGAANTDCIVSEYLSKYEQILKELDNAKPKAHQKVLY